MYETEVSVQYLHDNAHLMSKTAQLVNSEWPRSMAARLRSLDCKTQDEGFPVSILLVSGDDEVIGHSKAFLIPNNKGACFVESVVIAKDMRGKGLGKLIMTRTEEYVRKHGLYCIYLTTKNEERFYAKLGYEVCPPIVFCGNVSASLQEKLSCFKFCSETEKLLENESTPEQKESVCKSTPPPVPPMIAAPPPPLPPPFSQPCLTNVVTKVSMRKVLN